MAKKFSDFVEMAANHNKQDPQEVSCDLILKVEDRELKAHSVSISNRDLLFFTESGTVTYLVDSYGDDHVAELFDWDLELVDESSREPKMRGFSHKIAIHGDLVVNGNSESKLPKYFKGDGPELERLSEYDKSVLKGNRDRVNFALQELEHAYQNIKSMENDGFQEDIKKAIDHIINYNRKTLGDTQ